MSTGNSTDHGYYVEVRSKNDLREPLRLGDTWITKEWRHVNWTRSPLHPGEPGVNVVSRSINPIARQQGVMSYEHAHAMIAGSLAAIPMASMFLEFRLRKVKLVCDWVIEDEGVSLAIDFTERERAEEFNAS